MATKSFKNYLPLFFMLIPGIIYFVLFCYVPMLGIVIAFKDYHLMEGIADSPWVGMKYFNQLFSDPYFYTVLKNTLLISLMKLFFGFPMPILFAVLLNEIRLAKFKRFVQTASYLPHFISWIALAGILESILSLDGTVNSIFAFIGLDPIMFLSEPGYFRAVLVISDIWKEFGWGAIIYFAAIAGVDNSLHEAAAIDGATRLQRIRYITLPGIAFMVVIMLILSMANILNAGFDQIFNLYNSAVMEVSDIVDTYMYRVGIQQVQYSLSTALGIFKSVVALVLIVVTNRLAKKLDSDYSTLW
ncbi:ABC transporter permease subunit [Paenibacillus sp. MBLB2552]|uniref:ABC transporter permease subunit n=1 Tax=Paenibacillus mellifer TaxID=2937794 RepID=A0A9X2BSS7_9BACL|nr:ABC transporter permease subunit [Paenibacillus mellifer]MCK8488720.1 ABC transporter permease subunit [Paenibacillus mellifer]